jgi:hypothetical protein
MRIYIIGNDGIALCREALTAVDEGEIVVVSNLRQATAGIVDCFAGGRENGGRLATTMR